MIKHIDIDNAKLHQKIKRKEIVYGGNLNLKIYGTLQCKSGKRMKRKNNTKILGGKIVHKFPNQEIHKRILEFQICQVGIKKGQTISKGCRFMVQN